MLYKIRCIVFTVPFALCSFQCAVISLQYVLYGPFCVRCGVSGVRSAARALWCVICFLWFVVSRLWYVIVVCNMQFDLWYSLHGIWYVVS